MGYNEIALAIDFEFPPTGPRNKEQKKKENKPQIIIPAPKNYKILPKLSNRLDLFSRKIKIYSRINIKIKPTDINTYLHHLVINSIKNLTILIYFKLRKAKKF